MNVRDMIQEMSTHPKVAATVSALTTTTGAGTILEWIPDDIGKLSMVVGIVLSVVLIYTHLRKGRIEYDKTLLEIAMLKKEEAERAEIARLRREARQPTRREDDR